MAGSGGNPKPSEGARAGEGRGMVINDSSEKVARIIRTAKRLGIEVEPTRIAGGIHNTPTNREKVAAFARARGFVVKEYHNGTLVASFPDTRRGYGSTNLGTVVNYVLENYG